MMSDIGLGLAIIADSLPAKSPMSLNGKGRYLTFSDLEQVRFEDGARRDLDIPHPRKQGYLQSHSQCSGGAAQGIIGVIGQHAE